MEEMTERGLAGREGVAAAALQTGTWGPDMVAGRPAKSKQTHPSDQLLCAVGWGLLGVFKPFSWEQLPARWETCLGAGSDLKGRKEEGHKNKRNLLNTWGLRTVHLDRLNCFISIPRSKKAPGAGDGEVAPCPL